MSDPDRYAVPRGPATAETKVKGSRFLAFLIPVRSTDEAEKHLAALRKRYHDATHVCFAWKIGHGDPVLTRAADAGEPSGTAGEPILRAMERAGLSDCMIAVLRWFGGTKLGTGGLARAYGECAHLAAENATPSERVLREEVGVRFAYAHTTAILRLAAKFDAIECESDYGGEVRIVFGVPLSRAAAFREAVVETTAGSASIDARGKGR